MAANDFTIRVSGTVAYSDNSHGSFEAIATWKGNLGGVVAQHSNLDSLENFRQVFADKKTGVTQVLDVLAPGSVVLAPAAPATDKTVSSFVMEVSGLATKADNSKTSFLAQWVNGALNLFPSESLSTWQEMTESADARTFLTTVFEAVAGVGTVTITAA